VFIFFLQLKSSFEKLQLKYSKVKHKTIYEALKMAHNEKVRHRFFTLSAAEGNVVY